MSKASPLCQWIAGEPSENDACKCGQPALSNSPYCARHRARTVLAPETLEYRAAEASFRAVLAEFGLNVPTELRRPIRPSQGRTHEKETQRQVGAKAPVPPEAD